MNTNTIFIDNYIGLIDNLEPKYKLEIIERISRSLRYKKTKQKSAFGAFVSNKSAEELIVDIQSSRIFNRQIEAF